MEKRKMYNAYADLEGYNCFGCSPTNPYGLKCKFVDEGEYITCHWVPSENYQGFFHVLHGGIQATLIDEIASWAIFSHEKTAGVTTEKQVKYRRPVRTEITPAATAAAGVFLVRTERGFTGNTFPPTRGCCPRRRWP